jgi:hypothetical protein
MNEDGSEVTGKRPTPWLEITLTVILILMIVSSFNALFARDIRQSIENYCTQQGLWCAPPTPTQTFTPTPTNTPRPTSTFAPTNTSYPTSTSTPMATDILTVTPTP